ncbi:Mitochondrial import inner membrane translocase subunit Tim8 B [Myotis davidii]|uniref:Mitochondrial import inner membrane translocase subunit Tim8 B n=1 Tax=Myotis davidii TaxID=225400 RepID=L5LZM4_MYODS|nr:Mitochondrial import inner membrane translocase subunit Tim8 B [Myotis davidii]
MAELGEADEAELQRLVAAEQQKAQFTAQVRDRDQGEEKRGCSQTPGGRGEVARCPCLARFPRKRNESRHPCPGARRCPGAVKQAPLEKVGVKQKRKVHHFMELCWDKCVEKPGNRLDSRTENCLSSCVDRFIDTTLAITSRFAQIVQKGGQ